MSTTREMTVAEVRVYLTQCDEVYARMTTYTGPTKFAGNDRVLYSVEITPDQATKFLDEYASLWDNPEEAPIMARYSSGRLTLGATH